MTGFLGVSTGGSSKGETSQEQENNPSNAASSSSSSASANGITPEAAERFSEQDEKIKKLEARIKDVLGEAEKANITVMGVLADARQTNTTTTQVLVAVILTFIALVTAFVLSVYAIWTDYSYNNDQNRKYFFDLLKDYETKESAAANLKEFKDCLWYEGTKFCTRPR